MSRVWIPDAYRPAFSTYNWAGDSLLDALFDGPGRCTGEGRSCILRSRPFQAIDHQLTEPPCLGDRRGRRKTVCVLFAGLFRRWAFRLLRSKTR